jgi:hypothetical protein
MHDIAQVAFIAEPVRALDAGPTAAALRSPRAESRATAGAGARTAANGLAAASVFVVAAAALVSACLRVASASGCGTTRC